MEIRPGHWITGVVVALLLHAGIAAAVLWTPPGGGAIEVGAGGVDILLGSAAAARGSATPVAPESSDAVRPDSVAPLAPPSEVTAEAPPREAASRAADDIAVVESLPPVARDSGDTSVATEVSPDPPMDDAANIDAWAVEVVRRDAMPSEVAIDDTEIQADIAAVPAAPAAEPRPVAASSSVAHTEAVNSSPERTAVRAARVENRPESSPAMDAGEPGKKLAAVTPPGSGSPSDNGSDDREGGSSTSGGFGPGDMTTYVDRLRGWLERHKEYPRNARRRRQEGTAVLYFVVDREGDVLEFALRKSSGHELLDTEVRRMLERAQPLPPMPDSIPSASLALEFPVQFRLR